MENFIDQYKQISKTESSLFTLWSLFVLCDQNYQSLFRYRKLLDQQFKFDNHDEIYLDTINEAITYQILLKTCSFLDEWDKVFGIQTEQIYDERIFLIKKIAKPARDFFKTWKDIREFRNQAIAHNHRDKKGDNIYLLRKIFHMPNSVGEFGIIVYAIEKMIRIASSILPDETMKFFTPTFTDKKFDYSAVKLMKKEETVSEITRIDHEVRNGLFEHFKDSVDVPSYYRELLINAQ